MNEVRHFVYQPAGQLRRYIREILWVRSDHPRIQALLPETALTLVLRQSGSAFLRNEPLPEAIISGLQRHIRMVEHGVGSSLIIVRFTEVGAPAILHDRADILFNRTASLHDLLPRTLVDSVQNRLAEAHAIVGQIRIMEHFLTDRIRVRSNLSSQMEAAVQMVLHSRGRSSVAAIAHRAAMSQSTLERHFRATVGASPKRLSRLARLEHVCSLWDAGKNLTEIAFEAGYSDQPHLVHDFRLLTGSSPEEFLQKRTPRNLPIFYK